MAAPNVGDFAEDLLEINQNVSYGVVPVCGKTDVTHGNSQLRDTPPLYEDVSNPTRSSNVDTATLQLEMYHNEKKKVMRWILSCFNVLIIANIVSIIALVVAFALLTQLKSDIESLHPEPGSLEQRIIQLDNGFKTFLQTSQK